MSIQGRSSPWGSAGGAQPGDVPAHAGATPPRPALRCLPRLAARLVGGRPGVRRGAERWRRGRPRCWSREERELQRGARYDFIDVLDVLPVTGAISSKSAKRVPTPLFVRLVADEIDLAELTIPRRQPGAASSHGRASSRRKPLGDFHQAPLDARAAT